MCLRRVFVVLLLAALPLPSALAQSPVRLVGDPLRDVQQTAHARRLLAMDPDLQEHNLGVIVRDRVAMLWGPAPSAEIAFRAELALRTMIELVEIRNELFVSDLLEPVRRRVKTDNAKEVFPEWVTPARKLDSRRLLEGPIPAKPETIESKRSLLQELPPLPLSEFGPPQIEPDVAGERDRRLLEAVRTALQGQDRFRAVLFTVKEGRVSLRMADTDAYLLHEAAQIVSHLPHVAAVLVEVKTNPR